MHTALCPKYGHKPFAANVQHRNRSVDVLVHFETGSAMTEQEARAVETFISTINTGATKKKLHVQVMTEIRPRTSSGC
jgi:glucose/arabinose dehydrogenase